MLTLKRLIPFIAIVAAAAAVFRLSTYSWNFFAPSYAGGKPLTDQAGLRAAVTELSVNIGPRDLFNNNKARLRRAEEYVTARFKAAGCAPEYQEYTASGVKVRNIVCTKKGLSAPGEIVLVGAHYDTFNNPGADDNASGMAGLFELADHSKGRGYARTVKFAAFVNEEPPFFKKEGMGSAVYARAARERGDDIKAALILEMIGYFSEEKFSQRYPPLIGPFLPPKGNYMAQISNFPSRKLARRVDGVFRGASGLPLRTVALPSFVPGVDFSDHRSFWKAGYPAVMFTDTSFYRTPHYHKATDLPDTLNYEYMAAFMDGMKAALDDLAGDGAVVQREEKK